MTDAPKSPITSTLPGQVFPEQYDALLRAKTDQLRTEFQPLYDGEVDVYPSPPSHFRMRAEFRVWHEGASTFFAMFDPAAPRDPIEITQFPVGSELINRLMVDLLDAIHETPELRYRLFQVEFLTTLTGEALVTLVYHRKLDEQWEAAGHQLSQQLGIELIGRSRKQRVVLGNDYVTETLNIEGREYRFQHIENSFTQPNARVCEHMLSWACQQAASLKQQHTGDLLELYCGLCTFTLPLSRHFRTVLATEISRVSVRAALHNLADNGIENVIVGRMSAEEFAKGWASGEGRRMKQYRVAEHEFSTVFVDPPRAGLDDEALALVQQFDNILYISCNPETLRQNVEALADTHSVARLALFDQFPYTHHREAGVLLRRRS